MKYPSLPPNLLAYPLLVLAMIVSATANAVNLETQKVTAEDVVLIDSGATPMGVAEIINPWHRTNINCTFLTLA